jgi:hypothetical protein
MLKMPKFDSHAELVRVFRSRGKAQQKLDNPTFKAVEKVIGGRAAVVWAILQDREASKNYGDKGAIIVTPVMIAQESGYPLKEVETDLFHLAVNEMIRVTLDGKAVKAA